MSSIDKTLAERGARYGEFPDHAYITQGLKAIMQDTMGWDALADDQKEALDMIAHKIGRIINGDPNYIDSWTDIIGYTRLVEKRLITEQKVQTTFAFESGDDVPSVGKKLTGGIIDQLRQADKMASGLMSKEAQGKRNDPACPACNPESAVAVGIDAELEAMLRKAFGPDVEIRRIG